MKHSQINALSLEELEGETWPPPSEDDTYLVKSVYDLRRKPIHSLRPDQLARLVGQNVGLQWLLPVSVRILRDTLPAEASGGFYDDDLLSATLTRPAGVWETFPEIAKELLYIIGKLTDTSPYIGEDITTFHSNLPTPLADE